MSEPITPAISDRICQHMNADHQDALLLYAQVYGQTPEAEAAEMLAIDPQGMDLAVQKKGQQIPVRVSFDHELKDAEDAHHTLIAMIKQARSQV
jgi:putative heme iron utilization protein